MYNKIVIVFLLLSIIGFLIALYALLIQVFGIQSTEKATIISGVLSMIGGAIGALGAYFVASNQMNKQFQYEKRKEEKQNKEQILHTLKKLDLLNKDIIDFIEQFVREFETPHSDEIDFKLKVREFDLQYIVNKVDKVNDDILRNGYNLDYLLFSRALNNMYIDIIGFTFIHEKYKTGSLQGLRVSIIESKKLFESFDQYVNEHIEENQKELEKLNKSSF